MVVNTIKSKLILLLNLHMKDSWKAKMIAKTAAIEIKTKRKISKFNDRIEKHISVMIKKG